MDDKKSETEKILEAKPEIKTGDGAYLRFAVKTGLIRENEDLTQLLDKHVKPFLKEGDLIFISEKIVALSQGRIIPIGDIKPSWLANFLAKKVNNNYGTTQFKGFGHGTPAAMQLLIEQAGYPRAILAAAAAAVTRPFGIKGVFYTIAGKSAKSVDCPMSFTIQPYNRYGKLASIDPDGVARKIKEKLGHDVVIAEANYRGVSPLGKSNPGISDKFIMEVLSDNPMGQADELTPFCIVRKKGS
ncbi:MAG TPA: coenzyme F420-0:L-glutamate ligase [Candidatus Paceibacterota bacterium]|nr:coenzyme F420-0:L-glutamate ligase [Candidatus Paceibacterota bacterium]